MSSASTPLDWSVGLLKLIKDNYSITTGSNPITWKNNVKFTTGWYQEQLGTPQISITPLVEPFRMISIGSSPTYFVNRIMQLHIWVRPPTESNTSLGRAKDARYQIAQEVERILRSGSTQLEGIEFMRINENFSRENLGIRPPMLITEMRINLYDFRSSNKNALGS